MFKAIKNVGKHTFIYASGSFLTMLVGFLLLPIYTHYLSTDEYGTLELLDLTVYLVALLLAWVGESVVRFYYEYTDQEKKKQIISVAMITVWATTLPGLVFLILFSTNISSIVFESPDYARLFTIIFITMVISMSNGIPLVLLRIQQRSIFYISISLSKLALNLSLNILFIVHYKMGVMGILLGGLIANASIGIFLISYTLRHIRLSFSFKILFDMAKYGLPLMWTWFGMFIINFADRFLLQRLGSLSDVGIYALAYKFGMMPNFLILGPFMMIWAPKRFELVHDPNAKTVYTSIFTYFCFIQLFLGLGISVLVKDALILMSAPEFRSAYQYVPLILLSYIFYGVYIYIQFGVLFGKKTKYLAIATLTGAVLNIFGNYVLIPKYQVWGACVATLVSILFILIFIYPFAQRLYKIPYQFSRLFKMILAAAALFASASIINPSQAILSLVVKFAIASSFPFSLYLLKCYTPEELRKFSQIYGSFYIAMKTGFSFVVSKVVNLFRREGR